MGISGFTKFQSNHYCYVKSFGSDFIISFLNVYYMLIVGLSIQDVKNLKSQLSEHFAMNDLGEAK